METRPTVISFDCAQTLVQVDWNPPAVACDALAATGTDFDRQVASEVYGRLLATRWPDFHLVNRQRDEAACLEFWRELTGDWLARCGLETSLVDAVVAEADRIVYGPPSHVFALYDDVLPCLQSLAAAGIRMVIVSNWDNSLHRVVNEFGLKGYFDHVMASMEEGWEKPDARLFQAMFERAGVEPGEVLHIGDNPIDDVQGALATGAEALLLERGLPASSDRVLASLHDLPAVLGL
ncbi:MAG: HAD-IA family hydrolase [Armatimonadetes bacterium]|nr:HAD-IA family hydrolase [Armatimonadota bacterium]